MIPSDEKDKIIAELKILEKKWEELGYQSRLDAIYDLIVRYVYKI